MPDTRGGAQPLYGRLIPIDVVVDSVFRGVTRNTPFRVAKLNGLGKRRRAKQRDAATTLLVRNAVVVVVVGLP